MPIIHILALKVVEPVSQALTDFIDRPPDGLLNLEGIGMENRLCRPDEIGGVDIRVTCRVDFILSLPWCP